MSVCQQCGKVPDFKPADNDSEFMFDVNIIHNCCWNKETSTYDAILCEDCCEIDESRGIVNLAMNGPEAAVIVSGMFFTSIILLFGIGAFVVWVNNKKK